MRVRKILFFFILIFSKCFETCASGSTESAFDVLSDEVVMMPMKELATRDFIAKSYYMALYFTSLLGDRDAINDQTEIEKSLLQTFQAT